MRLRVIKSLTRARCSVSNSPPSRSPPRALVRRTAATGGRVDGSSDSRSRFVIDRRARVRLCRRRPRRSIDRPRSISKRRLGDVLYCLPIRDTHFSYTTYETPISVSEGLPRREHRRGGVPTSPRSNDRPRPGTRRHTRARDHSRANERTNERQVSSFFSSWRAISAATRARAPRVGARARTR